MSLKWIGSETLLNENAVAWISFSRDGDGVQATVRFLVPQPQGGELLTQVFSGETAERLRDLGTQAPRGETTQVETASTPSSSFTVQSFRKKKGWFFSPAGERPAILAFVNAKGSSSVRSYDAETGVFLGKTYSAGDYQDSFSDLTKGTVELTVDSQPNLERDCKERLPDRVLNYLRNQISEAKEGQNG